MDWTQIYDLRPADYSLHYYYYHHSATTTILHYLRSVCCKRLCIFGLYGAVCICRPILIFLLTSLSLPFSELSLVGLAFDLVD